MFSAFFAIFAVFFLRFRAEDLVDGHRLDRTKVERADAWLDHFQVADDDDREVVGPDVFLCDALDVRA